GQVAAEGGVARRDELAPAGFPERVVAFPVVARRLVVFEQAPVAAPAEAHLAVVERPVGGEDVAVPARDEPQPVRPLDRVVLQARPFAARADGPVLRAVGRVAEREADDAQPPWL